MRICTAPTVFDGLDREKVIAWLEQEPTIALMAALDARILELANYICENPIPWNTTVDDAGRAYLAARSHLEAYKQLREWVRQAETRAREVQHGKA